jgi:hypothetical protein
MCRIRILLYCIIFSSCQYFRQNAVVPLSLDYSEVESYSFLTSETFQFKKNGDKLYCDRLCSFTVDKPSVQAWLSKLQDYYFEDTREQNLIIAGKKLHEVTLRTNKKTISLRGYKENNQAFVYIILRYRGKTDVLQRSGHIDGKTFDEIFSSAETFRLHPFRSKNIENMSYFLNGKEYHLNKEDLDTLLQYLSTLELDKTVYKGHINRQVMSKHSVGVHRNANISGHLKVVIDGQSYKFVTGRPSLKEPIMTFWFQGADEIYQSTFAHWRALNLKITDLIL